MNHLRTWRQFCGLTLMAAAERAGCTPSTLSKLENGKLRLTTEHLHRLAITYGRTPAALLSPPGETAVGAPPPGSTDADDARAVARLWESLPGRYREHLLEIMEGVAAGDAEQQAFLDANIHAASVAAQIDIVLTATQRLHLIERALTQRAERQAAEKDPLMLVAQDSAKNY